MPLESFVTETTLPATPAEIYEAWLDGRAHSEFTGARATCEPRIGGAFTAWDGYIRGHIVDLYPNTKIVQEWTTTEFPGDAQPSRLEVHLNANNDGTTTVRLHHSNLPEGQGESYKSGWDEHYFRPMKQYFEARRGGAPKPPASEAGEPGVGLRTEEKAPAKPKTAKRAAAKRPAKKKAAARRPAAKKPAAKNPSRKAGAARKASAKNKPGMKKKRPAAKRAPARKAGAAKKAGKRAPAKKRRQPVPFP